MIKFVPGGIAAAAGFLALKLVQLVGIKTLGIEIVVFFGAFIVVIVAADRALRAYGAERR